MTAMKKIALFGGTGNIGRVMLSKLKEAKEFDLRVIARLDSTKAESPGVETVKVDYESQDSLVGAIRGCDIVVNVLSVMANQAHYAVLDAVIEAQVPRYYPSDWGSHPPAEGRALPLLQAIPWIDTRRRINYLVETAAIEGKLTYTSLKGGAWLETVLKLPVMFSLPERKFLMHKYPDTDYSYSSKDMYAEALLNALRLPDEETKNRYFEVELYRVSQRRTLELLRQAYPDIAFEQVSADCEERFGKAWQAMQTGAMSMEVHAGIMSKICLDPDVTPLPARNDNDKLGVKRLTDDEFKQMLRDPQA